MESSTAIPKKWGNSIGIILPKDIVKKENIKPGKEIEITVRNKSEDWFKKSFGKMKGKFTKSTAELLKKSDQELYDV